MKSIIIIAVFAFFMAACNNPSSPSRTMTDSTSVNSDMDTLSINNNINNSDSARQIDTMNTSRPTDSLR